MEKLVIKLIKKYQDRISPFITERGVHCLFNPTCSKYALNSIEKHNIFIALILISYRLLSCNPINAYIKYRQKEVIPYGKRV